MLFHLMWNVYSFLKLYSAAPARIATDSTDILDRYILAKLHNLVAGVTDALDNTDIARACDEVRWPDRRAGASAARCDGYQRFFAPYDVSAIMVCSNQILQGVCVIGVSEKRHGASFQQSLITQAARKWSSHPLCHQHCSRRRYQDTHHTKRNRPQTTKGRIRKRFF